MSSGDSIRAKLTDKFRAITVERLMRLNNAFIVLEKQPHNEPVVQQVLREIHTLKGEAKMMGMTAINSVAHHTEDLLLAARDRGWADLGELGSLTLAGFDLIGNLLEASEAEGQARAERYAQQAKAVLTSHPGAGPEPAAAPVGAAVLSAQATTSPVMPTRDSLRVDMGKLDGLTDLMGDLLLGEAQIQDEVRGMRRALTELRRDLKGLRQQVRGMAAVVVESSLDSIEQAESLVHQSVLLQDDLFAHHVLLTSLEERVRELRLVPLSTLFGNFPRAIRDLAAEQHKRIKVQVHGSDVAVDGDVLDQIGEPLLHLIRNAVDHGIEPPQAREQAHKPAEGTIAIVATQKGAQVEIEVRDDGAGLDPAQLRQTAQSRGLLPADAGPMSREELLALIFRPGFSTRTEVTDVSGRGVGLDVVRSQLQGLGGTVDMRTTLRQGTTFRLTVPVSMAMVRALVVQVGTSLYAVPSENVHLAIWAKPERFTPVAHGLALRLEDEAVVVSPLHSVLGLEHPSPKPDSAQAVLVLEQRGLRRGFIVQRFIGERQVLQRRLDPFCERVPLISGSAVLADGELALMLHVAEVMHAGGEAGFWRVSAEETSEPRKAAPLVLVVDDSEVTRDTVVAILQSHGYRVAEAVNGADALRRAEATPPDLILTDLEMPVVDGFALLSAVRSHPSLAQVPMVVFSTRGSETDRQRAANLGANAYIVKTTFREEELLTMLLHFLQPLS